MYKIVSFIDFNFDNSYSLKETITSMRDALIRGGPDDTGIFVDKGLFTVFVVYRLGIAGICLGTFLLIFFSVEYPMLF
jgi:asparagine synthase (glutamine-hydrolysing)